MFWRSKIRKKNFPKRAHIFMFFPTKPAASSSSDQTAAAGIRFEPDWLFRELALHSLTHSLRKYLFEKRSRRFVLKIILLSFTTRSLYVCIMPRWVRVWIGIARMIFVEAVWKQRKKRDLFYGRHKWKIYIQITLDQIASAAPVNSLGSIRMESTRRVIMCFMFEN